VSGIRAVVNADLWAVKAVAIETELFTAEDIGGFEDMLQGFLDGSLTDHFWIVLEDGADAIVGAAYYAPEPFSDRMWNLYFIGVRSGFQSTGVGSARTSKKPCAVRVKKSLEHSLWKPRASSGLKARGSFISGAVLMKKHASESFTDWAKTKSFFGNRFFSETGRSSSMARKQLFRLYSNCFYRTEFNSKGSKYPSLSVRQRDSK
jgi:hypothetical protein